MHLEILSYRSSTINVDLHERGGDMVAGAIAATRGERPSEHAALIGSLYAKSTQQQHSLLGRTADLWFRWASPRRLVCQTGPGCRPVARGTRIGSVPSPAMCI